MQRYAIDKTCPIGRGSFGQVFRAMDRQTIQYVAVKQIVFDPLKDGVPGLGMREISNLKALSHKRVARLIEAEISDEGIIHIVMEYADMNLQWFLGITMRNHGGSAMPEPLIQRLSRHLFKGLAHLHANGIIHRDLKPANILIDEKQSLKIADFGLSRIHSVPCLPAPFEASTLPYRPPEILLGEVVYSGSYDIWSAGCIVAEIVRAGELLFRGTQPFKSASQLESILMSLGTPDEEIWPQVNRFPAWRALPRYEPKPAAELFPGLSVDGMDLILQCLFYPPRYRLSAKRALLHPWLNKHVPAWFPDELAAYYIPEPM